MKVLFYARGAEIFGIEYISAILKDAGHQTNIIFDYGLDDNLYFKNVFINREKFFRRLIRKAEEFKPDIFALSFVTNIFPYISEITKRFKEKFKIPIIAGGIHPTLLPEEVLKVEGIDMVCIGEGEEAMLELVNKMEDGKEDFSTKNIWFKVDLKIIRNELRDLVNLDSLPIPDKDLFAPFFCFSDTVHLIATRGCPYRCTYCYNHIYWEMYKDKGKFLRQQNVEKIIEELLIYKKKYNPKNFFFQDDTFTFNKPWLKSFSELYKKNINRPFSIISHLERIDEEVLEYLKAANCSTLFVGIESGSDRIRQKVLNRNILNDEIKKKMKLIKKYGMKTVTFLMFGLPHETEKDMWDTVNLIKDIKPNYVGAGTFYPFPKTRLTEYCIEKGFLEQETVDYINQGRGTYSEKTLLKHENAELAINLKNLIAFFNWLPSPFSPLIKILAKTKSKWLMKLINLIWIITMPYKSPLYKSRLKEYFKQLKLTIFDFS